MFAKPVAIRFQPAQSRWLRMLMLLILVGLTMTSPSTAKAQFGLDFGGGGLATGGDPVTITAKFQPVGETQQAILEVKAEIEFGYHIYSMTQKDGLPSTVSIVGDKAKLVGPFVPDRKPAIHEATIDIPYETETFEGQVIWKALIEFKPGIDVSSQRLDLKYAGLACNASNCNPYNTDAKAAAEAPVSSVPAELLPKQMEEAESVSVEDARPLELPEGSPELTAGNTTLSGWLNATVVKPGEKVTLTIQSEMEPGYHTYAYLPASESVLEYAPSYMGVVGISGTEKTVEDFGFQPAKANQEPHPGILGAPEFSDSVQWTIEFDVPKNPGTQELILHGVLQSQTCDETSCNVPEQLQWHVSVKLSDETVKGKTPLVWAKLNSQAQELLADKEKAKAFLDGLQSPAATDVLEQETEAVGQFAGGDAFDVSRLAPQPFQDSQQYSLFAILGIALLGGFILNFMPCVLPVIGLKILSLVEQAGESRSKAIAFNSVYVLGMLSVFWILAALLAVMGLGWGSQFSSTLFNVVFAAVVFAMALSYLDIWEIVLPSFVGTHSTKLESKDGWMGTFFKGAVTTILATPCSGPGLATALAWCTGKPTWLVFVVFTFLGLGMGLPYILVAIFPPIISFLPKPGPWMNTFKQVMGFVLLGTVAFFLSYLDLEYLFPTVCFLMIVWFACWLVGRLTFSSTVTRWTTTWASSIAVLILGSYLVFGWQVSEKANEFLGGDFNQRFASEWNLVSAQKDRMNSFVDRQLNNRGGISGMQGGMLATRSDAQGKPVSLAAREHGGITWVPYSLQALEYYTNGDEPKTVFVDFTADWCQTCKVYERVVLHSEEISSRLGAEEVVAMIADKTHFNEEIDLLLNKLGGGNQIPLYAVFPKSDPYRPIVMDGTSITFANVNSVLDQVGVPAADDLADPDAPPAMVEKSADPVLDQEDGLPPVPTETVSLRTANSDSAM